MRQIAEELGVGYLIEGSVRRSGDCMRITAQLSDVDTGRQLGGERYDRSLADMFAVQDEITEAIGNRAASLCRGEHPRPAQAAAQPARLGSRDARAAALGA